MPLSLKSRILENKLRARKRVVIVKQSNEVRHEQKQYQIGINSIVTKMVSNVHHQLLPMLEALEKEYISDEKGNVYLNDGYATTLVQNMSSLKKHYRDVDALAQPIASQMVRGVDSKSKRRFYKAMKKAVGIDLFGALAEEGVTDVIAQKTAENVELIQSIPDEYFKKLMNIVGQGTTTGEPAQSMIDAIFSLGESTYNRAKLIARDQTQKVNAAITQTRQESLGITKYRWRTVGDERVRTEHIHNNGKIFEWSKPPKNTGHPGHDIQCRCIAEPIIDLDNL